MGKRKRVNINEMLHEAFRTAEGLCTEKDVRESIYRHFLTGVRKQRRFAALKTLASKVKNEIFTKNSNYNETTVIEFFFRTELLPLHHYNISDRYGSFRVAAAIWMLETLAACGKLEEACRCIPDVSGLFEMQKEAPYLQVEHICFPSRLVQAMAYALTFRYYNEGDDAPIFDLLSNAIIPDALSEGKSLAEWYKKLVALLPKEAITKACEELKKRIWECCILSIETQLYFADLISEISKKAEKAIDIYESRPCKTNVLVDPRKKVFMDFAPTKSNVLEDGFMFQGMMSYMPKIEGNTLFGWQKRMADQIDIFGEAVNNFADLLQKNYEELYKFGCNDDLAARCSNYDSGDPYELCFALIWLLDNGDNTPWLMRTGGIVMDIAETKLPWYKEFNKDNIQLPNQKVPETEFSITKSDMIIGNKYYRKTVGKHSHAQLLYQKTRIVIPENVARFTPWKDSETDIGESFITTNRLADMAGILTLRRKYDLCPSIDDIWAEKSIEEDAKESVIEEPLKPENRSLEAAECEISALKEEAKKLKKALGMAQHKLKKAEAFCESADAAKERYRRELADLQEILFAAENDNLAKDEDEAVAIETGITYPYVLQKKTVVFGGHDTFLKAIRKNFPSARFVDVDKISFSPEIIKNADIIWIQNNNISHPQFWNIISVARQYDKEVRYFASAGVARCSRQLAEADRIG